MGKSTGQNPVNPKDVLTLPLASIRAAVDALIHRTGRLCEAEASDFALNTPWIIQRANEALRAEDAHTICALMLLLEECRTALSASSLRHSRKKEEQSDKAKTTRSLSQLAKDIAAADLLDRPSFHLSCGVPLLHVLSFIVEGDADAKEWCGANCMSFLVGVAAKESNSILLRRAAVAALIACLKQSASNKRRLPCDPLLLTLLEAPDLYLQLQCAEALYRVWRPAAVSPQTIITSFLERMNASGGDLLNSPSTLRKPTDNVEKRGIAPPSTDNLYAKSQLRNQSATDVSQTMDNKAGSERNTVFKQNEKVRRQRELFRRDTSKEIVSARNDFCSSSVAVSARPRNVGPYQKNAEGAEQWEPGQACGLNFSIDPADILTLLEAILQLPPTDTLVKGMCDALIAFNTTPATAPRGVAMKVKEAQVGGYLLNSCEQVYFSPWAVLLLLSGTQCENVTIAYDALRSVRISKDHHVLLRLIEAPRSIEHLLDFGQSGRGKGGDTVALWIAKEEEVLLRESPVQRWVLWAIQKRKRRQVSNRRETSAARETPQRGKSTSGQKARSLRMGSMPKAAPLDSSPAGVVAKVEKTPVHQREPLASGADDSGGFLLVATPATPEDASSRGHVEEETSKDIKKATSRGRSEDSSSRSRKRVRMCSVELDTGTVALSNQSTSRELNSSGNVDPAEGWRVATLSIKDEVPAVDLDVLKRLQTTLEERKARQRAHADAVLQSVVGDAQRAVDQWRAEESAARTAWIAGKQSKEKATIETLKAAELAIAGRTASLASLEAEVSALSDSNGETNVQWSCAQIELQRALDASRQREETLLQGLKETVESSLRAMQEQINREAADVDPITRFTEFVRAQLRASKVATSPRS